MHSRAAVSPNIRDCLPQSLLATALAAVWVGACLYLLRFGYLQRNVHDMPEAFVWLLFLLTFPAGALAATLVGVATGALAMALGTQYHPFWDELPIWFAGFVVGYWQWFVFLPRQFKRRATGSPANDA